MSLDVAPDGRTIVFDLLGDLYTLPITGGVATRLTEGTALNRQPRYSRDGRQLVFVSDRGGSENLWISDREGRGGRQLSDLHLSSSIGAVTSPVWSLDGQVIFVAQRFQATHQRSDRPPYEAAVWLLAAYDVATGHMRWVSDTAPDHARGILGPAADLDGRTLYAAIDVVRKDPWRDPAGWRIACIDIMTGRITTAMNAIPSVGAPVTMRPAISPDRRYLVFARSSGSRVGLRIRDLRTDQERWLVREALDNPEYHLGEPRDLAPGYAFTPDSKALIIAYGGKIHRIEIATGRGSLIPFVANVARKLGALHVRQFTLPDTASRTRSVMQPSLSPDGHWVAFSSLDRIWIMELSHDGHEAGRPYRATSDSAIGEFYPSWSPNGQWIAYSGWMDGEGGAVRRVRVPQEVFARPQISERLTTDTAVYFHTAVTADGARIIAVRASLDPDRVLARRLEPRSLQLVWVSTESGGQPHPVTSLARDFSSNYQYPADQVYLTADTDRVYVGLKSWSWPGMASSNQVVTTPERTGGGFSDPDVAGVFSPDRCRALIAWNYSLFELHLPSCPTRETDTLDLEVAQTRSFDATMGAAHRWGTALSPWISWSRDGRHALFSQGGTLFVGEVRFDSWTAFERVDVPLKIPVDIPRGTTVLRGARLVTMRGYEVIARGDIVVRDNRIIALGPSGRVAVPDGARTFDLHGMTILPGYIDIHEHAWLAQGVHPQQWWGGFVRLAYGVTGYREATSQWGSDVFTARERERAGQLLAPRIFSTGLPYYGTYPPIQDLQQARERVRANADYFDSETFKVYDNLSTNRRARQLLAIATAELGLNATAHTEGPELQLASVIDGLSGVEHAPNLQIYNDLVTMVAASGTTQTHTYVLIPGALNYMIRHHGVPWVWPRMRRFIPPSVRMSVCAGCMGEGVPAYGPAELDNLVPLVSDAARIAAKGGHVAIGAHGWIPGIGFHYEMWLHALGGMREHDILRSATIVGATAIGHAADIGSLEVGKLADLQVLGKNPLDDIHNTTSIRYVMKNGRLYQADDLTEVWPRHRSLPSIYSWDQTPMTNRFRADRNTR
jgi:imidazolonepropionase-like amidohydrolase/Tol biopolymer transport system component